MSFWVLHIPPRAFHHATVTVILEAGENFLVNSASGGLSVYVHKHPAPAVKSSEDAAEGRKMFIPLSPQHSQMPILSCCNTG